MKYPESVVALFKVLSKTMRVLPFHRRIRTSLRKP
jgi:hypothetical protein